MTYAPHWYDIVTLYVDVLYRSILGVTYVPHWYDIVTLYVDVLYKSILGVTYATHWYDLVTLYVDVLCQIHFRSDLCTSLICSSHTLCWRVVQIHFRSGLCTSLIWSSHTLCGRVVQTFLTIGLIYKRLRLIFSVGVQHFITRFHIDLCNTYVAWQCILLRLYYWHKCGL